MNRHRLFLTMCALVPVTVLAQEPVPPVPPVAPAAPATPAPAPAPRALRTHIDDLREGMDELRFQIDTAIDTDAIRDSVRAQLDEMRPRVGAMAGDFKLNIPFAFAPQKAMTFPSRRYDRDDRAYERGQRALDGRRWDEALDDFTQAAGSGGSRVDGALYWKAYALAKLGRRDDAVAALAELRKSYPSSRWLEDAKALELEVKQASGQKPSPEAESDEDLKLMALNGLVQSDPERALPLLENLFKTSSSPKLKERALFVLAQSNSPRGKQLLEQVARGGAGNPDLQLKAISYLSASSKRTDNRQLLWEIYSASNDSQVKGAVLNGLMVSRDKDHLLQIAKTEKDAQIRMEAISMLGASGAQVELWQIYQAETSADLKQRILHSLISSGASDRVLEVAKTEKDAKLRRTAIQALGSMNTTKTGDALVSMYGSETDPAMKKSIIDGLYSQRNAKALVDLARKESDPSTKREIVSRLSHMKSKESTDYLMEILK
jgi:tetratricopeptide (TPR) repeat protein